MIREEGTASLMIMKGNKGSMSVDTGYCLEFVFFLCFPRTRLRWFYSIEGVVFGELSILSIISNERTARHTLLL